MSIAENIASLPLCLRCKEEIAEAQRDLLGPGATPEQPVVPLRTEQRHRLYEAERLIRESYVQLGQMREDYLRKEEEARKRIENLRQQYARAAEQAAEELKLEERHRWDFDADQMSFRRVR